ncbi:MAG: hypothetical protein J0L53_00140 [Spirochaetes bacterium]|nr:hypothetical protein [Spirochaetota bacterium]
MSADRHSMVRIFVAGAALNAVIAVVFAALIFIDSRQLLGISAWVKPLKFAVTSFVYLGTLALFARHLPDSLDETKGNRAAWIISAMIFGEVFFIGLQSARGVTSHFNQKTLIDGIIYSVMGVMIIVNTVVFIRVFRHFFRGEQKISGAYLSGIRWGAVLFVIGSVVGGAMSGLNRHTIGIADGGPGLPLVNFSTVAGDLRIAHFVGLHALQVLPFLGWLIARGAPARAMTAAGIVYTVAFVFVLVQAFLAQPLLRMS